MPTNKSAVTAAPLTILGFGRVGGALALRARSEGVTVAAIGARNTARARRDAAELGLDDIPIRSPAEAAAAGQLILLCVPDDAIASALDALLRAEALPAGAVLAHCSGVHESALLAPARAAGLAVGSFHPLQTFPTPVAGADHLAGSTCFCEGDADALPVLHSLAEALGAHAETIPTGGKALYHAGAVVACNYLCALADVAGALFERAGIPRAAAWQALSPLVHATLENLDASGPAAALTGPLARGDAATIGLHLDALARDSADTREAEAVYRALGRWTVGLAERGGLDAAAAAALRAQLARE